MKKSPKISKEMFKKLYPQTAAVFMIGMINTIIDGLAISAFLGTDALAAIGFYSPLVNILSLYAVYTVGTQMLCFESVGVGDISRTKKYFSTCAVVITIYALICTSIMFFAAPGLAGILGAEGYVKKELILYLRSVSIGTVGMMFFGLNMSFLQVNSKGYLSKIAMITLIGSNAILDVLLPKTLGMGMTGMGLATSISNLLSGLITMLGVIPIKKNVLVYFSFKSIDFKCVKEMIPKGLNSVSYNAALSVRTFVVNGILSKIGGSDAVAVMAVLGTVSGFLGAIVYGSADTVATVGSIYVGEKNVTDLTGLLQYALRLTGIITVGFIALFAIFSGPFSSIYFETGTDVWKMSQIMVIIYSISMIGNLFAGILLRMYLCLGKIVFINTMSVVEQALIILFSFVLSKGMGINGVWLSFTFAEFTAILIILLRAWRKTDRVTLSFRKFVEAEQNFHIDIKDTFAKSIKSFEEAVNVSAEIEKFCEERAPGKARSMMAALCMEEMTCNIANYGFSDGKEHTIDIFVLNEDGNLRFRIMDDCAEFDPTKYIEQFNTEDLETNIGIKTVSKIADKMEYQHMMKLNVLSIYLSAIE